MSTATTSTAGDLAKAITRLTPDEIRARLADLSAEQHALRTLLRAALASERARRAQEASA